MYDEEDDDDDSDPEADDYNASSDVSTNTQSIDSTVITAFIICEFVCGVPTSCLY